MASPARADDDYSFPTVMDRRWSASMAYGVVALRDRSPDPETHVVAGVDLALHLRLRPEWELGLALTGAVARGYGYAAIYPEIRYRFAAERPWNTYVCGSAGIARGDLDEPFRLFLRGGGGLERRLTRWAFAGELHVSRVNGNTDVMGNSTSATLGHFGALDAGLTVSAIYYWGRGHRSRRQRVP